MTIESSGGTFEVEDYSFDVEQVLSIGFAAQRRRHTWTTTWRAEMAPGSLRAAHAG